MESQAYTRNNLPAAQYKDWEAMHNDPLYTMGFDVGMSLLSREQARTKEAVKAKRAAEKERDRHVEMQNGVRERANKTEAQGNNALKVAAAYARERAGLVVARARPDVEAAAHGILVAVKEAFTLLMALYGEVQSIVEKVTWSEVLSVKCDTIVGDVKRRAQIVPGAEKDFLLRLASELGGMCKRK